MALCFQDTDSKKTCCCGCSLVCGVITFAVLAGLEGLSSIIAGMWVAAIPDLLLCLVGVGAVLQKSSATMAVVNYWTWVVMDVLFVIWVVVFGILGATILRAFCESAAPDGSSDGRCDGVGAWVWLLVAAMVLIGGPLLYLGTMVAYYYVAEKKSEADGYQKA